MWAAGLGAGSVSGRWWRLPVVGGCGGEIQVTSTTEMIIRRNHDASFASDTGSHPPT